MPVIRPLYCFEAYLLESFSSRSSYACVLLGAVVFKHIRCVGGVSSARRHKPSLSPDCHLWLCDLGLRVQGFGLEFQGRRFRYRVFRFGIHPAVVYPKPREALDERED